MKPFENFLQPHPASTVMSYRRPKADGNYGEYRRLDLEFYYANALACSLPLEAPEDIRKMWEVAQHLLAYAYFEYPFVVAADLHGVLVVEAVFKMECKEQIEEYNRIRVEEGKREREPGFSELLGFFKKKTRQVLSAEEAQFLHERLNALRKLRNSMAHPKGLTLYPPGNSLMIMTSQWLGAYYKGQLKEFVQGWMKWSKEEHRKMQERLERAKHESTT